MGRVQVAGHTRHGRLAGAMVLVAVLLGLATPARASAAALPARLDFALVRLHVVAHSDSPHDQRLKLAVRDAVVRWLEQAYAERPPGNPGSPEAWLAWLAGHHDELAHLATQVLRQEDHGRDWPVRVELGRYLFPETVDPMGVRYPAGSYRALRVVIGAGRGHNWWCVLFPSLCPGAAPGSDTAAAQARPAKSPAPPVRPAEVVTPPQAATPEPPGLRPAPPVSPARPTPAPEPPWWRRLLPWNWFR